MKTFKIVFAVVVTLAILAISALVVYDLFQPKLSGLVVTTVPDSNVYIDGNFVGKTPYRGTFKLNQLALKLVPIDSDQNLLSFETKVDLSYGVQTVVRREFGTTENNSSGDVISFEKINGALAGVAVVSAPENSEVLIDGVSQGFTPFSNSSISVGSHQITIQAPGYSSRTVSVKAQSGFRLTVFAKLSVSANPTPTPSPSLQQSSKTYVVIANNLPNGFLRMRTGPGTAGEEIAQLKSGDKYLYLDTDKRTGWYKIQYQDPAPGLPNGMVGWISNQYSSLATSSATLSK